MVSFNRQPDPPGFPGSIVIGFTVAPTTTAPPIVMAAVTVTKNGVAQPLN